MKTLAKMQTGLTRLARREEGQGVSEYIIILAVIVIACIVLAVAFHSQLETIWNNITKELGKIA